MDINNVSEREQLIYMIKIKSCTGIRCEYCVLRKSIHKCCSVRKTGCIHDKNYNCKDCEIGPYVSAVKTYIDKYGKDQLVREVI